MITLLWYMKGNPRIIWWHRFRATSMHTVHGEYKLLWSCNLSLTQLVSNINVVTDGSFEKAPETGNTWGNVWRWSCKWDTSSWSIKTMGEPWSIKASTFRWWWKMGLSMAQFHTMCGMEKGTLTKLSESCERFLVSPNKTSCSFVGWLIEAMGYDQQGRRSYSGSSRWEQQVGWRWLQPPGAKSHHLGWVRCSALGICEHCWLWPLSIQHTPPKQGTHMHGQLLHRNCGTSYNHCVQSNISVLIQ